eukprot:365490-Chlamydomonas_euryale.AAC.19
MENARVAVAPKDARGLCFRKRADRKYVCSLCKTVIANQHIILGCTQTSLVMEVTKRHPARAPWGSEWMVAYTACMQFMHEGSRALTLM